MNKDAMKGSPDVRLPGGSQKFSGWLPVHNPHKQFPHCVSAFIQQARPGSISCPGCDLWSARGMV